MEKFKSHQQVHERCKELIADKQIVCQTIQDMATLSFEYLSLFNLEYDYIFQDLDETSDTYGMWKVGRGRNIDNYLN